MKKEGVVECHCTECGADHSYYWDNEYAGPAGARPHGALHSVHLIDEGMRKEFHVPAEFTHWAVQGGYGSNLDLMFVAVTEQLAQELRPMTCEKCLYSRHLEGKTVWEYPYGEAAFGKQNADPFPDIGERICVTAEVTRRYLG